MPADNIPIATVQPHASQGATARIAGPLAAAAALGLAVLLAIRPLASPDLGYHLAYGETFLKTGRIVDSNEFLYTLPGPGEDRPAPGPGCWYDQAGRYRFANANWLSQVIIAVVYRWTGAVGLCVLQVGLVAGIFALMLLTMRRMGVGWPAAAAGVLLAAITGYMRFSLLRPEVFAYLILVGQLYVLVGRRATWRSAGVLVGLQLLLVNLHSYFLLGLALTAAFLADRLWRLIWCAIRHQEADADRPQAARVACALAGQVVVCFANPWTWRLAALPLQTLVFMHANHIVGGELTDAGHPWSYIGEFFRPFAQSFAHTNSTYAYCLALALAAGGALVAAIRRRWDFFLVIAGMTAMSLSMRRNITLGAMLVIPPAMAACWAATENIRRRLAPVRAEKLHLAASAAVILLAAWFAFAVVTQRFYFSERMPARFGVGLSKLQLPLEAAAWLGEHPSTGRLWTDYTASSNFHYFTAGRPQVPIVTNTWAYPPAVMARVLAYNARQRRFGEAVRKYGIDTVALSVDRTTAPLAGALAADSNWALVHLDAMHAVFRTQQALAASRPPVDALTPENFEVAAYVEKLKSADPLPAYALHVGGITLFHLGWVWQAGELFGAAVAEDPGYYEAWNMRGICLVERVLKTGNKEETKEALNCFTKALDLKPTYEPARVNFDLARKQLGRP